MFETKHYRGTFPKHTSIFNLCYYRNLLQYWLILLHYREVLYYREFITLLEQNIIITIFQDIPLVFMAAILKIGCVIEMCMHLIFIYFILVTIFKSILLYITSIAI